MNVWWRSRQWLYARPRIAGGVVVALALLLGFTGWMAAGWLTGENGTENAAAADAQTTVVQARPVTSVRTVVVTKRVTRVAPTTVRLGTRVVTLVPKPKPITVARTVTDVATSTVALSKVVTSPVYRSKTRTVTVTQVRAPPARTVVSTVTTPGRVEQRTVTEMVTATVVQTVLQPTTVIVTVTTNPGHH